MNRKIYHTPDGVRDIYEKECRQKIALEDGIRRIMHTYGYQDIETPSLEFFDVFGSDVGTIPSRELYKFFDRDGETIVLRPDFTPSIARAASKYFMDKADPIRLCYKGNTFVNHSSYQGRLKETTQMGCELIGDGSAEADAEMLAMVIDTILGTGLTEFQISIGNVQYFRALVSAAGVDETVQEEVAQLIRNKNSFGVEKLLQDYALPEGLTSALRSLPTLNGGEEVLTQAKALAEGVEAEQALAAIARLQEVYEILKLYGKEKYVSFDLGMMSGYMYYTGIIFRGYTYGTGEAIVKGGRYDDLLEHFGKRAPSIGFVVVVNQLMNAMLRQGIKQGEGEKLYKIVYQKEDRAEAIRLASNLRREGRAVQLIGGSIEETSGEYVEIIRIGGRA